ncbi:MAG: hypothetical protein KGJ98_08620 [Chloroflexota bacterium]|nr:hypothetical protein [Chloroflexota bacterium]
MADVADDLGRSAPPGFLRALRQFLYGMTGHEFAQEALGMRAGLETLFMLVVVGDMIGVPVLPPYYALRVLPFIVPEIQTWKRRVLREREFTEEHEFDLHGV